MTPAGNQFLDFGTAVIGGILSDSSNIDTTLPPPVVFGDVWELVKSNDGADRIYRELRAISVP
jgi:hypothetical protein